MVYYYLLGVFVFYLCKALFSGFLQFKGKFVDGENVSKSRDIAPLTVTAFAQSQIKHPIMSLDAKNVPVPIPGRPGESQEF